MLPSESSGSAPVIIVVEDDVLIRDLLRGIFEGQGWIVDDYPSGEAFLQTYRRGRGACLLVDDRLPGISGIEVLRTLQRQARALPTIMITGASDIATAVAAMKAGADNFIQKPIIQDELLEEVGRVIDQADHEGRAVGRQAATAARLAKLTPRQQEVLYCILAGQSNKSIAAKLAISQRTVETHRAAIMKRTGSKSIPALVRTALLAAPITEIGDESVPVGTVKSVKVVRTQPSGGDSEQFDRFFREVPLAIVVAQIAAGDRIFYANAAFESLTGQSLIDIDGRSWDCLLGKNAAVGGSRLGPAIAGGTGLVGSFHLELAGRETVTVDAHSNIIVDDEGKPDFRLVALTAADDTELSQRTDLAQKILEKDARILEIQHRVKNNLQMITALIRIESRKLFSKKDAEKFDRLAGRIESIQIIYRLLSNNVGDNEIDLGVYLSEIASSVMHAHGAEGIRLDLKVDSYPVSVNVALPTGLVANEILTNALKHAFVGRDFGTITLHSLTDEGGCSIVVADDGIGLPEGVAWPKPGKLGELIVSSLRQNARADLKVDSRPGQGTRVTIRFGRAAALS